MLARTQSKAHGGQIARLSFQHHTKQSLRGYQTRRAPEPASPEVSRLLASFVQQPSTPLTLSALLSNARPASEASVLASVAHVQAEVPRRLAARIASLEALPYIVGTNPHVARTLRGYRDSFVWLATQPPVRTLVDNGPFTQKLAAIVDKHADDLPRIARGFQECTRYMTQDAMTAFLDGAIKNRIAVRLLAEQHIAVSRDFEDSTRQHEDLFGVVHAKCSPAEMIRLTGSFVNELCEATLGKYPPIEINGHVDATFSYIPVHLQYVLTELLKNSFRAAVEHHDKQHGSSSTVPVPPVTITISPPPTARRPFLSLRIRDQGGGVPAANIDRVFAYAFTTAGRGASEDADTSGGPYAAQHIGGSAAFDADATGGSLFADIASQGLQTGMGTIAGLGFGLPMSRLYSKYFGGGLELLSLEGWGTDCVVKLRSLDYADDVEI